MNTTKFMPIRFAIAIAAALAASAVSSHAQGETASGQVSGVPSGPNYDYTITLDNTSGSVSIGSFWYSWTPTISPFFYLPSVPTSASTPTGWTAAITANSIQYSNTNGVPLAPGAAINFQYVASFTPAQLTGITGYSYVYHGGIEAPGDPGSFLNVQTVAAPEPSSLSLLIVGSLGLLAGGWRKLRAQ
jgi:hypothetical protein